jgi:hypothetical protein
MVQQVCTSLQLPVYGVHTVDEGQGEIRGKIDLAMLPENIFGCPERMVFPGETARTDYGAIENAAETVLRFMADQRGVRIDYFNCGELEQAYKARDMAESFQQLFREAKDKAELQQALYKNGLGVIAEYADTLRSRYDHLTDAVHEICMKCSKFFILPAHKIANPALARTPHEEFVFAVTQLLHHMEETEQLLLREVYL